MCNHKDNKNHLESKALFIWKKI